MSFKAEVLRVLIASPSDVNPERDEVERAIFDWNSQYAEEMGIVLLPGRWEKNVTPTYRGTEGGQAVINEQLVSKCDILIGVFWTKLGTPTLMHSSGTLEEIDIFIKEGKEVMVYFVDRDVPRHGINYNELGRVDEFKDDYTQKGVYGTYNIQEISKHLYSKVANYKKKNQQVASIAATVHKEIPEEQQTESTVLRTQTPVGTQQVPSVTDIVFKGNLRASEILILQYIMETQDRFLGARWMAANTLELINKWQSENNLASDVKDFYEATLNSLLERRLITEKEYTLYGNPRQYVMPLEVFNQLIELPDQQKYEIQRIVKETYELPF